MGTQQQTLSPDPSVGNNTYAIINIVDNEGKLNELNPKEFQGLDR